MTTLGRLRRVNLRDIWKTEDRDFTPWLAKEENLLVLAETLHLELELEAEEKPVGPFRADILCKDTADGSWVLIENQLERTDHTHLGQLLTYAAGLEAVTIVWIANRFTEEHRAALDWLNEATEENIRFFGLEVEVWRIGDSPAAPKFNVVSKPNEWSRAVGSAAKRIASGTLSETKEGYRDFWSALFERMDRQGSAIKTRTPLPDSWMPLAIGRSNFHLIITASSRERYIGAGLYIQSDPDSSYIRELMEQREAIESEVGEPLKWQMMEQYKGSRVDIWMTDIDPLDRSRWSEYTAWMHEKLEKLYPAFKQRVRAL